MQLIGQEDNLELIKNWNKLPNFLIIQGEEHSGKNHLVLYLCQLFKLHYKEVPKSVKEIRNLVDVMAPNSNTIYHLKNFDDASIQAKNALLKVTEEPIPGNYIVITGGPQIKTLQSRARLIIMSPYKYNDIENMYTKYYTNIDSRLLYDAGINTPAKIEFYKSCENIEEILEHAYDIFDKITYLNATDYIPIMKLFDNRYDKGTVDVCMLFLNMLIKLIENKATLTMQYSYYDILNVILKIKNQLKKEYTLNRKLLIFKMFYEIESLQNNLGV